MMADELMWVCVWVSNVCVLRQGVCRKSSGTLDGKGERGWSQVTRDRKAEVAMMTIGNKKEYPMLASLRICSPKASRAGLNA